MILDFTKEYNFPMVIMGEVNTWNMKHRKIAPMFIGCLANADNDTYPDLYGAICDLIRRSDSLEWSLGVTEGGGEKGLPKGILLRCVHHDATNWFQIYKISEEGLKTLEDIWDGGTDFFREEDIAANGGALCDMDDQILSEIDGLDSGMDESVKGDGRKLDESDTDTKELTGILVSKIESQCSLPEGWSVSGFGKNSITVENAKSGESVTLSALDSRSENGYELVFATATGKTLSDYRAVYYMMQHVDGYSEIMDALDEWKAWRNGEYYWDEIAGDWAKEDLRKAESAEARKGRMLKESGRKGSEKPAESKWHDRIRRYFAKGVNESYSGDAAESVVKVILFLFNNDSSLIWLNAALPDADPMFIRHLKAKYYSAAEETGGIAAPFAWFLNLDSPTRDSITEYILAR